MAILVSVDATGIAIPIKVAGAGGVRFFLSPDEEGRNNYWQFQRPFVRVNGLASQKTDAEDLLKKADILIFEAERLELGETRKKPILEGLLNR